MMTKAPGPSERLLSVSCYLGLAPLTSLWRSPFGSVPPAPPCAGNGGLPRFTIVACVVFPFASGRIFILTHFPELDRRLDRWELGLFYALLLPLAALVAMWIALVVFALAGSIRQLPLLGGLTSRPWAIRFSSMINSLALALIPLIAILAFHATSLTRPSREGDKGLLPL